MSAEMNESPSKGGATPSSLSDHEGAGLVSPEGEGACGFIALDRSSYSVGDTAVVTWEMVDIRPHPKDFIGMFELDDGDHMTQENGHVTGHVSMERLLDSRLRGDTSLSGGRLQWNLSEDIFPRRKLYSTC